MANPAIPRLLFPQPLLPARPLQHRSITSASFHSEIRHSQPRKLCRKPDAAFVKIGRRDLQCKLQVQDRGVYGKNAHNTDGNNTMVVSNEGVVLSQLLKAVEDKYDGVVVDIQNMHNDVDQFESSLKASLSYWASQGKKGVWIKVPLQQAKLVPVAIEEGFWYHHAEASYVMLVYWIPQTLCTLPDYASHQVAIGAFVFNDNGEVLAVQEKNGPYRGSGLWKMITGVINQGEDIYSGAIREVKEETGIECEFIELLGFRHCHNAPFGKSDLLFLCMMKPLSSDIVVQETEVTAVQWMPIKEFVGQPKYRESKLLKQMLEVCVARIEKGYRGFSAVQTPSKPNGHQSVFYCNVLDLEN